MTTVLTKYSEGYCANCGADKGLHMSGTFQCPMNGREETRFNKETNKWYPQEWQDSFFENVQWKAQQEYTPIMFADWLLENCELWGNKWAYKGQHYTSDELFLKAFESRLNP